MCSEVLVSAESNTRAILEEVNRKKKSVFPPESPPKKWKISKIFRRPKKSKKNRTFIFRFFSRNPLVWNRLYTFFSELCQKVDFRSH